MIALNSDQHKSIDMPSIPVLVVSMGSDIEILSVSIWTILSSKEVMILVSERSDGESVIGSWLNDPLVSLLILTSMSSDVEIFTEFSVVIIRAEYIMVGISKWVQQVNISPDMSENDLISLLLACMNSDIEILIIISMIIIGNKQNMFVSMSWSQSCCLIQKVIMESFNDPLISSLLMVMSSDIKILTISIWSIISREKIEFWVSEWSDSEDISFNSIDIKLISIFMTSMSSDIEILTEFSMMIVWDKQKVLWISMRSNMINIPLFMDKYQTISCLIAIMSSNIKILSILSMIIIRDK